MLQDEWVGGRREEGWGEGEERRGEREEEKGQGRGEVKGGALEQ